MKGKCINRFNSINNNQGVALVIVIMVFVVMTILGTSAVSMVYSDNMFSQQQEDSKKAHYAARAAVATVEQAIFNQLEILESLEIAMDEAIKAYEDAPTDNNDIENGLAIAAETEYNNYLNNQIYGKVLPTSSILKHNTIISQSLETDSETNEFVVEIESLGSDNYKLSSTAIVNGKKGHAVRVINIEKNEITKEAVLVAGTFDDTLYAYYDIIVDSDNENKNKVKGGVTYGKGPKPVLTVLEPNVLPEDPRNPNPLLDDAETAFNLMTSGSALASKTSTELYTEDKKNKSYDIDSSNSGYYLIDMTLDGEYEYNVDTSSADVILRFDGIISTTNKPIVFNAFGGGNLIIYINSLNGTGTGNNFELNGSNQSGVTKKTDIYLYINSNDALKNNFDGNNAFIYAPTTTVEIKNNATFKGSLVAGQILMKNNGTFEHAPAKLDFPSNSNMYTIGDTYTIQTLTVDPSKNHWIKK